MAYHSYHSHLTEKQKRYRAERNKKLHKSPKKTIEEDLAWMFDEKSAFLEDVHRTGRRTGGAGPRKLH